MDRCWDGRFYVALFVVLHQNQPFVRKNGINNSKIYQIILHISAYYVL